MAPKGEGLNSVCQHGIFLILSWIQVIGFTWLIQSTEQVPNPLFQADVGAEKRSWAAVWRDSDLCRNHGFCIAQAWPVGLLFLIWRGEYELSEEKSLNNLQGIRGQNFIGNIVLPFSRFSIGTNDIIIPIPTYKAERLNTNLSNWVFYCTLVFQLPFPHCDW